ncbi:MAG: MBL fold metallo-hydrolase [Candidatus Izemoplasmatales bacterium]|nr:MBL fold metallo-hydrolase [Candidatus Izemoplasmatales bacterium]
MINITKYSSSDMDVNTYVLAKDGRVLVIDPGFCGAKVIKHCENHHLKIDGVILTHGHIDHIRDLKMLLNTDVKIYINKEEVDFLKNPNLNLSTMFRNDFVLDKNVSVTLVDDEEVLDFLNERIKFIHLPGHTKGSMGIVYNQHFFCGDTLFYDGIGRTDLPTGNIGKMQASLKRIMSVLPKNTVVYPGHGKGGKLAEIILLNPYLK